MAPHYPFIEIPGLHHVRAFFMSEAPGDYGYLESLVGFHGVGMAVGDWGTGKLKIWEIAPESHG